MPNEQGTISFRPLAESDLEMMAGWLEEPHVAAWWGPAEKQMAQMRAHIEDPAVSPFVVLLDDLPFAYIQLCDLEDERANEPALAAQPSEIFGLDQFIGPVGMTGRGLGSRFVSAMAEMALKTKGAKRVLVDPHSENAAAIRAYEKAGFVRLGTFSMTSGPALLMARDR